MTLSDWDRRYLEVAKLAATWSMDPDAKIGAVIVDAHGQIAAIGHNAFPHHVEETAERYTDKQTKLDMIVHAEENAILGAGERTRGATLYVVGKPVCARCAGAIVQAGIKRVVAQQPQPGTASKWDKSGLRACEMLRESAIDFTASGI